MFLSCVAELDRHYDLVSDELVGFYDVFVYLRHIFLG